MTTQNKESRYTGVPGSPAGLTSVKNYREEISRTGSKTGQNDGCGPNPKGRLQLDDARLKEVRGSLKIGTWNVRTLFQQGKLENLIKEAEDLKVDILGICEHRWTEDGVVKRDSHTLIYSGGKLHEYGVGVLLTTRMTKYVMGTWPVSNRNLLVKLTCQPFNISLIQTYAPTGQHTEEEVEIYYEELQMLLKEVKSTEVLIISGDFNAKVGEGQQDDIVGKYGLGERNERGERLIQFCEENNLMIANTHFRKHSKNLYTWKSPGDCIRNQIDYILVRKRFRNSVKD